MPEVDGDLLHCGQDDEHIRVDQPRQQRRGKVLVDHGGYADELPLPAHDRDAAAARGDDDAPRLKQRVHGVLLDDIHRLRRGDDLPIAAARVLDHGIALLFCDALGSLPAVKRADGLRRATEGGVELGDERLA